MTEPAAPPATILVVDDDRVQRMMLERTLRRPGWTVLTAQSAAEALALAKRHRPALIISDYYMPGQDGFELCRQVRARPELADCRFILLTAASAAERKIEGLDLGADDFLTKPVNAGELRSRVQALLRIHSLHDELRAERAELERANHALSDGIAGILTLLAQLIGQRVPNAAVRAERAAALVAWIGARADLPEAERHAAEVAARIHEIGKLSLPDAVLGKPPATLGAEERSRWLQFPVLGSVLVAPIPRLELAALYLRHQLENHDGTGIPDGLEGDQIPVGARLLRLVNLVEQARAVGQRTAAQLVEAIRQAQGTILTPPVAQLAVEYFETALDPSWRSGKRQVTLDALQPGMRIAVDLCTGGGTKLLSKGTTLTRSSIERVLALQQLDPILNQIFVYDPEAAAPV